MPIDSSLYRSNPLRSVSDYEGDLLTNDARRQGIQQNALALQTGQMMLDDRQRALGDQQAIRNALTGLGANATDDMRINALKGTGLPAAFTQADALEKAKSEKLKVTAQALKDNADAEKTRLASGLQHFEMVGQVMSGVNDQASYDNARNQIAQVFGPQAAAQLNPVYNPQEVENNRVKAMSVKEQMEQRLKLLTEQRLSSNSEIIPDGKGGVKVNEPLIGAKARVAQAGASSVVTMGAPVAGMLPDGTQGLIQTGNRPGAPASIVTMPGTNTPFRPAKDPNAVKLKDIPPTVNAKIIEGVQGLDNIDKAISAIEAYPDALGRKNMLPGMESIRQTTDPKGVDVRAQVANIGSLKLHDRSGAAVSASEFPRLAPFIPSSSDTAEGAVRKLKKMKEIAEGELGLFTDVYNEDSGYKPSPVLNKKRGATPSALPDDIDALLKKHGGN